MLENNFYEFRDDLIRTYNAQFSQIFYLENPFVYTDTTEGCKLANVKLAINFGRENLNCKDYQWVHMDIMRETTLCDFLLRVNEAKRNNVAIALSKNKDGSEDATLADIAFGIGARAVSYTSQENLN